MPGPESLQQLPSSSGQTLATPPESEAQYSDVSPEQSSTPVFPQLSHEIPLKGAVQQAPWMQPINNPFGKQPIPNPLSGFAPNPNYQSPYNKRSDNPAENVIPAINNMVKTGAAVINTGFARAYEAMHGQGGLIRPETDIPQLGQAGQDIASYYTNEYAKPLADNFMSPKPPWQLDSVFAKHFQKAPVETLLDAGIPSSLSKSGPLLKAEVGMYKKVAGAGLTPKGKLGLRLAKRYFRENQPAWFEYIKHRIDSPMRKAYVSAANVINRERLGEYFIAEHELDNAWVALKPEEKRAMHAILQYTDRDLRKLYQDSPTVKYYADVSRKYAEVVRKTLDVPELIHDKTIYGPQLLSILYRQGKRFNYEDLQGPRLKQLLMLKSRMKKMGIAEPVYVAQVLRNSAAVILNDAKNKMMGGLQGKTGQAAKHIEKGEIESLYNLPDKDIPGFAREREAAQIVPTKDGLGLGRLDKEGKPLEMANPNDSLKIRLAQIGKYEAIKKYVRKVINLQADARTTKNWEEIPVDQILRGAAKEAGMTESAAAREVIKSHANTSIKLPHPIAEMVKSMTVPSRDESSVMKILQTSNRYQRMGLFALDPTFGPRLTLQTEMLKLMALKSPKEALAGIVGNLLALHPNAEHAIPTAVMLAHDIHANPELLKAGLSFAKVLDAKQKLDYVPHNWQRRGFALSKALYGMSDKPPSMQRIFTDMLNVTKELMNKQSGTPESLRLLGEAGNVTYVPQQLEKLQKHIKGYLGDYGSQAKKSTWRTGMDLFLLTGPWVRHWGNIALTLPFEHPVKLSIYSSLTSISSMLDTDKYGFVYLHDKAGNPILGANGKPKKIKGWELDAIHSVLELAKDVAVALGAEAEIDIPSSLPWWMNALVEYGTGYDMQTKREFVSENPELHHPSNRQVKKFKQKNPEEASIKYSYIDKAGHRVSRQYPTPWYIARQAFPKQINPLTELSARDGSQLYVPSPYTYPTHPAPKTTFKGKGRAGKAVPLKRDWEDFYAKLGGVSIRD